MRTAARPPRYISHNIGHLMMDEFWPWFNLMRMFNLLSEDSQPLATWADYSPGSGHAEFRDHDTDRDHMFTLQEQCLGFEAWIKENEADAPPEECQTWAAEVAVKQTLPDFLKAQEEGGGRLAALTGEQMASIPMPQCAKYRVDTPGYCCGEDSKEPPTTTGSDYLAMYVYRRKMIKLCTKIVSKMVSGAQQLGVCIH